MHAFHLLAFGATMLGSAAIAGEPTLSVGTVRVDNTFRVPADSGFNPADWVTLELLGRATCPIWYLEYQFALTAFQSPGGDASPFPLPVGGYDANPLSRYDSFLRHPLLEPEDTLLYGAPVWTSDTVNVAMGASPFDPIPSSDHWETIGRMTIAVGDFIALAAGTAFACQNELGGPLREATQSLSGPIGSAFEVREINDQYDELMDIEAQLLYTGDSKTFPNLPATIFFPASRVVSVSLLTPIDGWSVAKAYHEGEFGIVLRSTDPLPEDAPITVAFRATLRDAAILRDVRFPRSTEVGSSFDNFRLRAFGYWAPVADSLLAGDTNDDGVVDFADLNNVLASFGGAETAWRTDFDGSGTVDFADLNAVLAAYGSSD